MKVEKLTLRDFRRFAGRVVFPFHPQLTVIAGSNGSGKSSVLDALADLLGFFPACLMGAKEPPFGFGDTINITISKQTAIWIIDLQEGSSDAWYVFGAGKTADDFSEKEPFGKLGFIEKLRDSKDDPSTILPFLSFIHSSSTRLPVSHLEKQNSIHPRLIAYRGAFDTEPMQFTELEAWFEQEENWENQQKIEQQDLDFTLPSLQAVRTAVRTFLSALQGTALGVPKIVRSHNGDPLKPAKGQLVIPKEDNLLFVNQLSDGERRLILMIADTARRMVVLNPGLANPLESPGVLLVDEIELHLHPGWQRTVVPALLKTFPKIQYILTTHSPQVLASVEDENVLLLKDGKPYPGALKVSGRDTNTILESAMGVTSRPLEIAAQIKELYAWMEPHPRKAKKRLKELEARLGMDEPELVRARAMMEFLGFDALDSEKQATRLY